ncbi:MAG: DUF488 family protein [Steroidobacter sp.]
MTNAFFTIGHSTRSLSEFVELLQAARVGLIVDVRAIPRSRTNPQFNREAFADALTAHHLAYEHIAALGGRRGRSREESSPNTFWENQSFRNYADYAMGEVFRSGFERLRALGRERPCAIMCAEAVWWRCHRRIIADYLLAAGDSVFHIMGKDRFDAAALTAAARPRSDGILVYPAQSATSANQSVRIHARSLSSS